MVGEKPIQHWRRNIVVRDLLMELDLNQYCEGFAKESRENRSWFDLGQHFDFSLPSASAPSCAAVDALFLWRYPRIPTKGLRPC
jgi:hypothetical protein